MKRTSAHRGVLTAAALLMVLGGCSTDPGSPAAGTRTQGSPSGTATPSGGAAAVPSASPSASSGAPSKATPGRTTAGAGSGAGSGSSAPAHFATKPPGSTLPSGAQCTTWVRQTSYPENKAVNKKANSTTGHHIGSSFFSGDDAKANSVIAPRVDGQFTGTTRQILRWAACKWGIDEDMVYAQAAIESWWRQTTLGDFGSGDASRCAPGHAFGVDGRPNQCPESFGILQNRYPYEQTAWPGIGNSTAMNADLAYAIWRTCFEGYETWLNTVEQGRPYAKGDAWGCFGRWFAGRWHTQPADDYTNRVKDYLNQRIWTTTNFQEP